MRWAVVAEGIEGCKTRRKELLARAETATSANELWSLGAMVCAQHSAVRCRGGLALRTGNQQVGLILILIDSF